MPLKNNIQCSATSTIFEYKHLYLGWDIIDIVSDQGNHVRGKHEWVPRQTKNVCPKNIYVDALMVVEISRKYLFLTKGLTLCWR